MERILVSTVGERIGREVTIAGFVETIRDQGNIKFLILRDVSGTIQVVVAAKENPETAKVVERLSLESVIVVRGLAKSVAEAPGGIEVGAEHIEVLSAAAPELPIPVVVKGEEEETEIDKRLDWRWIDLRKPEKLLIFKVATLFEEAFREYWNSHHYIEIHSPKLMSSPSESGADLFEVQYFERRAYLAQSPQFYKQMAMAAGFERVFEVGPVFRAEPSFTSRHSTEFTGFDAEISYIDSHQDVMQELGRIIRFALERVKSEYADSIAKAFGREVVLPALPFPQLTMKEAKKILQELGAATREPDLTPEEERKISEYIREKENHEFVFITEYPISVRPFYHMRLARDPSLTKSFDLLWNGLEMATGAEREHRYDILISQAKETMTSLDSIEFYLNFFKYGCPPHGGFGMGPTRMLMKLLGLSNIREATYLYRGVKRLEP